MAIKKPKNKQQLEEEKQKEMRIKMENAEQFKKIDAIKDEICYGTTRNPIKSDNHWKSSENGAATFKTLLDNTNAGFGVGNNWNIGVGCNFENVGMQIDVLAKDVGLNGENYNVTGKMGLKMTVGKGAKDEKTVVVIFPSKDSSHSVVDVFVPGKEDEDVTLDIYISGKSEDLQRVYQMEKEGKLTEIRRKDGDLSEVLVNKLTEIDPRIAEAYGYATYDREIWSTIVKREETAKQKAESKYSQLGSVTGKATKEDVEKGKGFFGKLFSKNKETERGE